MSKLFVAIAVLLAVAAPARGQFVQGVDVSRWQGDVNWTAVKNAGISFAFCKATEGVDFVDIKFHQNMANARAAGVWIGPYHYARPDSFENDPLDAAKEAHDFVDAIEQYYQTPGFTLQPVLDMEEFDLEGVANFRAFLSECVRDFNDVVESRLGFPAIIYASTSYINAFFEPDLAKYDLWLANWNYAPPGEPPASASGIFGDWAFWQYTGSGSVAGISPIDRDVYEGTLEELVNEFRGVQPTADFDQDGDVDGADFLALQRGMGRTGAAATFAAGNADGDLQIDGDDFAVWNAQFAAAAVIPATTLIPEPATAAIAALLVGVATAFRRRHS
jgi:GH25 family lysozyme M1 (1,4-beta-N-acetylmuramidase)